MSSTLDNVKAVNAAWGFSFPNEKAWPKDKSDEIETCTRANSLNYQKFMICVPLMGELGAANAIMSLPNTPSALQKQKAIQGIVFLGISALTGPLAFVLKLIIQVAFTVLVKPWLNLYVYLQERKLEQQQKNINDVIPDTSPIGSAFQGAIYENI